MIVQWAKYISQTGWAVKASKNTDFIEECEEKRE